MFFFKNQFITPSDYIFIFWKFLSLVINTLVFNFQNMINMLQECAYQISNSIALKFFTRIQPSLP
jgi:hypothetical protein